MRCQYCKATTKPTEGGFPDRCFECGAWFDLNKQIKEWEKILTTIVTCLRDESGTGHPDYPDELEAIYHEMERINS
jgi:hypothetical protein